MSVHLLPIRIYWEDTDAGGIVYHASYVRFLERGRTEFLRALGIDQSALIGADGGRGVLFVVRRMTLEFLAPARLDDMVEVETRLVETGGARLSLAQSIRRGSAQLITVAVVGLDGRPRRLPADLKARMSPEGSPLPGANPPRDPQDRSAAPQ